MRLIDADVLMEYVRNRDYQLVSRMGCVDKGMFTDGICQSINTQSTVDAVPVVRCKDCRFAEKYVRMDGKIGCYCNLRTRTFTLGVNQEHRFTTVEEVDDFCSHGERRNDDA